jgi:hypothetical protein
VLLLNVTFDFSLNVVFNGGMEKPKTPDPDWALILALGGAAAVARELNLPENSGAQTVQNWKYRGIPARVKLARPDLFLHNLQPLPKRRRTPTVGEAGA